LNSILEASKEFENQVNNASSSTVENWNGPFEWDSQADDLRLNIFGIASYRANQKEVKKQHTFFIFLNS
jgi:ATP-dependent DNA helicase Q1